VKRFSLNLRWSLILLLIALASALVGCSTAEPDNTSSRPWNSPKGWENGGIPGGGMNQYH